MLGQNTGIDDAAPDFPLDRLKMPALKNNQVRNAFAILQAFRGSEDRLTSRELSLRANLPKSTGLRLILTL